MPKTKKIARIKEPVRGMVSGKGSDDTTYATFLAELHLDEPATPQARAVFRALNSSSDPRFQAFLQTLSTHNSRNVTTLAKHCNISLIEFMDFVRKAYAAQVIARSMAAMLPLTEDLIGDAASKQINCERCDGVGFVFCDALPLELAVKAGLRRVKGFTDSDGGPIDRYVRNCPACDGKCKIAVPGDADSRKTLIEQSGLHDGKRKGAGGVTINFGGAGIESAVSRMSNVTFDIEPEE